MDGSWGPAPLRSRTATLRKEDALVAGERVTLNLISQDSGRYVDVLGSAVLIAPYLALTARHVVKMFNESFERARRRGDAHGEQRVSAVQTWAPGTTVTLAAEKWYSPPESDFAVLRVRPVANVPADYEWRFAVLDMMLPRVGDELVAFGFSQVDVQHDETSISVRATASVADGAVRELLDPILGNPMHGWPRFRTNARFHGGMSGGPVMLSNGFLGGIVSTCMPAMCEDEEHASFVPLLWPAMAIEVDHPFRPAGSPLVSLLQLAWENVLTVRGRELVYTRTTPEGFLGVGLHSVWHRRLAGWRT